ncbi:MAG: hypothetical protein NT062_38250 [Proteobacteria bacterium]|nr:hypothetical protein [Pseudomonadota bacterium]
MIGCTEVLMTFLTPARLILALLSLVTLLGLLIAPDLFLQLVVRSGFVLGGIAITLALRPVETTTNS